MLQSAKNWLKTGQRPRAIRVSCRSRIDKQLTFSARTALRANQMGPLTDLNCDIDWKMCIAATTLAPINDNEMTNGLPSAVLPARIAKKLTSTLNENDG